MWQCKATICECAEERAAQTAPWEDARGPLPTTICSPISTSLWGNPNTGERSPGSAKGSNPQRFLKDSNSSSPPASVENLINQRIYSSGMEVKLILNIRLLWSPNNVEKQGLNYFSVVLSLSRIKYF